MEFRLMGRTGLKVSELCLGAMTFGRESDISTSYQLLDTFKDAGGNFIDTADVYSRGTSEKILGRWLKQQNRYDWVIATKVRFPMGDGPNDVGVSRKHILQGVEDSLRRLGTDYIDLYQLHGWDAITPIDETLSTLDGLVKSGKVRYIGTSNYSGWQLQKTIDRSRQMGWEPFTCLQPQYNLLTRTPEWEVLEVCKEEGVGVIPWSPLRGGWLSGKYHRDMTAPPPNTRVEAATEHGWSEAWENIANDKTWHLLDVLKDVAATVGKSQAQVALNWLLRQPVVTAPIIGARKLEHLQDNLGATGWSLTDEQLDKLNAASDPGLPYPYDFVEMGKRVR